MVVTPAGLRPALVCLPSDWVTPLCCIPRTVTTTVPGAAFWGHPHCVPGAGRSPFCASVSSGPTLQMRTPREAKASGQDCTLHVLLSQVQALGGVWAPSAAGWAGKTEA